MKKSGVHGGPPLASVTPVVIMDPPPPMTAAREKCADIITFGLQKHNNSSQAGNWGGWLPPGKLGRFPEFRDSKLATSQGGEVYYPKPQIIGQRVT